MRKRRGRLAFFGCHSGPLARYDPAMTPWSDRAKQWWLCAAAATVFTIACGAVLMRYRAPEPESRYASPTQFSAERAVDSLTVVQGAGNPRSLGSPANAEARRRVVTQLKAAGWRVRIQKKLMCGPRGLCAVVHNIVARLPGPFLEPGVLLTAHYDSVPAGPGSSDDGHGVGAVLEIARNLKARTRTRRSVVILVTDGEEAGLLGAKAFMASDPHARRVRDVVNLEARGTTGPSLLFETGANNGDLIAAFGRGARRPITSSLLAWVYQKLPNDTDFSVFKRGGLAGANLAYIGGVTRYHTPLDNLAHLDRGSVQHQGENALSLVWALANRAPAHHDSARHVFFDVLAWKIVQWPVGATSGLLLFVCLALCLGAVAIARAERLRVRGLALSIATPLLALLLTALLGAGVHRVLASKTGTPFVAHPWYGTTSAWLAAALGVLISYAVMRRQVTRAELSVGGWLLWTLLGALVAARAPELSYLLLAPALVACLSLGLLAIPDRALSRRAQLLVRGTGYLAGPATALVVWLPVIFSLYDALGYVALWVNALICCFVLTTFGAAFHAFASRGLSVHAGVTTALTGAVILALGWATPQSTKEEPQRVSMALHYDADAKKARWLLDASSTDLPPKLLEKGAFGTERSPAHPWFGGYSGEVLSAPATIKPIAAPKVKLADSRPESGGTRTRRMHVVSKRRATMVSLHVPSDSSVEVVRVGGLRITPWVRDGFEMYTYLGSSKAGARFEVTIRGEQPTRLMVSDHTSGLPKAGRKLKSARGKAAVPSQFGDATVATRWVEL